MVGYYGDNAAIAMDYVDSDIMDRAFPIQMDIIEAFDVYQDFFDQNPQLLEEADQERNPFITEVMDIPKFIKRNPSTKEITNPVFFSAGGAPTPDGLLSNEIFGITKADRSGIYGYIDLVEWFIDPSCYKALCRIDKKFISIIHATSTFSIDGQGVLVPDPNGGTGIKWLKENFKKLSFFKESKSRRRDLFVTYIKKNYDLGRLFINKYLVIPAYYRDANTSGNHPGVGQINTLYNSLIVGARSLRENNDYGLSVADTTCARMQDTLKAIYDWFCGNKNDMVADPGTGMGGKMGIMRRANLSKTSDYGSRLVISAPELKAEKVENLMVSLDKSAAPLAAVAADFLPFMKFHMRRFFENQFLNVTRVPIFINGKVEYAPLKNPMQVFNDDVIMKALKQFLYSDDSRFIPIESPIDREAMGLKSNQVPYLAFFGTPEPEQYGESVEPITQRPLTWVDVIFIAACKSVENKTISITRYPYDSYFNTFYTGVNVASTRVTEPLYINGEYYPFYPKIRMEDIGKPSASKFVDTMQISNLYLNGIGGDYDGDTIVMKGSFFKETNEELTRFMNSKANFINMGCSNIRVSEKEAVQALYNLTKVLYQDKDKLTKPVF